MGFYHGLFFNTLLILAQSSRGEYGDRIKNATETWGPNLEMQESRYYDHIVPPRPRTELPINFQAPYINAKDYWTEQPRRTIFDYESHFSPDGITRPITEGINSFYGLMNHFFGAEEPPPRRKPNYPNHPKHAPYEFEQPYYKHPVRQQYLPNPKPLRASVIKLEPFRSPPPFVVPTAEFTTAKYYPQFVKILNDVLIENSYKNQLETLGLVEDPTVLEKPEIIISNIIPTTYKPKKPILQKTTPFPGSIQDQLPPIRTGQDTRIPYVSELTKTTPRTPEITTGTKMVLHNSPPEVPPLDIDIDVRSAATQPTTRPLSPITFTTSKTVSRVNFFETTTSGETGLRVPLEETLTTRQPLFRETTTNEPRLKTITPPTVQLTSTEPEEAVIKSNQSELTTGGTLAETTISPTTEDTTSVFTAPLEKVQSATLSVTEVPIITVTPKQTEGTTTTESPTTTITPNSEVTTAVIDVVTPQNLLTLSSENRPVITDLIQTMENLEPIRFNAPFPKKLVDNRRTTTDATNSADYVTDLTIRGLADGKFNINNRHVSTVVNMSSVVGFEIAKLNATSPPLSGPSFSSFEDELSLDAKILKDTNWDGYQPPIPQQPGTETITARTVERATQTDPSTMATLYTTTIAPTKTTPFELLTTTENLFTTMGTTELPTTVQPKPTVAENSTSVISTRVTQTVSRSRRPYGRAMGKGRTGRVMKLPNFEDKFTIGASITEASKEASATATPRPRKYQRRAKVQAFTPYPTQLNETDSAEKPLKLGTLSRPFQPKRSRVNATLTFSNTRASKRADNMNQEKEFQRSTTKRSSVPRKELYKRRSYPSQLRRRTTEETLIQEE